MDINHLKALVAAAKSSEHLYEEQTAAMVFATLYGEQLIAVVEFAIRAEAQLRTEGYDTRDFMEAIAALEEEV